MGAVATLQEDSNISMNQAVDQHSLSISFDTQLAWHKMSCLYVAQVHDEWFKQMPLGHTVAELKPFKHTHPSLVKHLDQLFKIESLADFSSLRIDIATLGLYAFQDWLDLAQQLGLMMLSVPLRMEINGKLKLQFLDSFGHFSQNLTDYVLEDSFEQFYQCITYKSLKLISKMPPEQLLRESSFQAWAIVSLCLPKGITQRVHLTIPPEWVAEIQKLRNRFASKDILKIIHTILPVISNTMAEKNFKNAHL